MLAADSPREHIASIDVLRVAAVFAVVLIHVKPAVAMFPLASQVLIQLCTFAVPFFFCASGYFFGQAVERRGPAANLILKYAYRLAIPFLVWSLIGALQPAGGIAAAIADGRLATAVSDRATSSFHWISSHLVLFLFAGTAYHLWFLPSLLLCVGITFLFLVLKWDNVLPFVAVGLYLFGLLAGPYRACPIGIEVPFNPRNGPFFWMLFFVAGLTMFRDRRVPPAWLAVSLIALGIAGSLVESCALGGGFARSYEASYDLVSTIPFGFGVMLLALRYPTLGQDWFVARWGSRVFGIYLVHVFVITEVNPWWSRMEFPVLRGFLAPFAVFFLSLLLTVSVPAIASRAVNGLRRSARTPVSSSRCRV
jgi:surface polysaccharide O-acyltransferase-like enzyme